MPIWIIDQINGWGRVAQSWLSVDMHCSASERNSEEKYLLAVEVSDRIEMKNRKFTPIFIFFSWDQPYSGAQFLTYSNNGERKLYCEQLEKFKHKMPPSTLLVENTWYSVWVSCSGTLTHCMVAETPSVLNIDCLPQSLHGLLTVFWRFSDVLFQSFSDRYEKIQE